MRLWMKHYCGMKNSSTDIVFYNYLSKFEKKNFGSMKLYSYYEILNTLVYHKWILC